MVINDTRQLVRWHVVMSPNDEISEVISARESLQSKHPILELNLLPIIHPESPIEPNPLWNFRDLLVTTGPRIDRLLLSDMRCLQRTEDILPGTCAWINCPACLQSTDRLSIKGKSLALIVRSKMASYIRPLVPRQTKP